MFPDFNYRVTITFTVKDTVDEVNDELFYLLEPAYIWLERHVVSRLWPSGKYQWFIHELTDDDVIARGHGHFPITGMRSM